MKIVVIGGTGLIGSKTVERLRGPGRDVVAASPASGVNTFTGEGLSEALAGATTVIDLANSPSFEDGAVMAFFTTAGHNLLAAARAAGVRHHLALSVVGTDRMQASGYFRGKQAQEDMIRASGLPFTLVHSTQFFEFMGAIAGSGEVDGAVRVSTAAFQPIAADDVAAAMADIALSAPADGIVEIAGRDRLPMSEAVGRWLEATGDPRALRADPRAPYFGAALDDRSLVPGDGARLGATRYADWLARLPRPDAARRSA
ncbi:MAG: SDR family oxidoreductase [Pseudomonadota bacterium]|nr:SDR family oxidoreductase [Pseudomonadota bacterium]